LAPNPNALTFWDTSRPADAALMVRNICLRLYDFFMAMSLVAD